MAKNWLQRLITAGALVLFGSASLCSAQAVSYSATLTGANEVPANASVNKGATFVSVDAATGVVTWNTTATIAAGSVTGHHIHRGAAGTNGPVVVNFSGTYSGTVTATTALAAEIVGNPTNFYVNLHTAAFPGGEIRAQLAAFPVGGAVPTISTSVLVLLGLLLAGFGAYLYRRNQRA